MPESSVTLDYFKTSAAETAALSQYLENARQARKTPWYKLTYRDCRDFCLSGLVESQVLSRWNANSLVLSTPNTIIGDPMLPAELSYLGGTAVTSAIYSVTSIISYGSEVPGSGQGQGDAGSGATPPDGGDGGDDGPPN